MKTFTESNTEWSRPLTLEALQQTVRGLRRYNFSDPQIQGEWMVWLYSLMAHSIVKPIFCEHSSLSQPMLFSFLFIGPNVLLLPSEDGPIVLGPIIS